MLTQENSAEYDKERAVTMHNSVGENPRHHTEQIF